MVPLTGVTANQAVPSVVLDVTVNVRPGTVLVMTTCCEAVGDPFAFALKDKDVLDRLKVVLGCTVKETGTDLVLLLPSESVAAIAIVPEKAPADKSEGSACT